MGENLEADSLEERALHAHFFSVILNKRPCKGIHQEHVQWAFHH